MFWQDSGAEPPKLEAEIIIPAEYAMPTDLHALVTELKTFIYKHGDDGMLAAGDQSVAAKRAEMEGARIKVRESARARGCPDAPEQDKRATEAPRFRTRWVCRLPRKVVIELMRGMGECLITNAQPASDGQRKPREQSFERQFNGTFFFTYYLMYQLLGMLSVSRTVALGQTHQH